jgi:hypothetical protein
VAVEKAPCVIVDVSSSTVNPGGTVAISIHKRLWDCSIASYPDDQWFVVSIDSGGVIQNSWGWQDLTVTGLQPFTFIADSNAGSGTTITITANSTSAPCYLIKKGLRDTTLAKQKAFAAKLTKLLNTIRPKLKANKLARAKLLLSKKILPSARVTTGCTDCEHANEAQVNIDDYVIPSCNSETSKALIHTQPIPNVLASGAVYPISGEGTDKPYCIKPEYCRSGDCLSLMIPYVSGTIEEYIGSPPTRTVGINSINEVNQTNAAGVLSECVHWLNLINDNLKYVEGFKPGDQITEIELTSLHGYYFEGSEVAHESKHVEYQKTITIDKALNAVKENINSCILTKDQWKGKSKNEVDNILFPQIASLEMKFTQALKTSFNYDARDSELEAYSAQFDNLKDLATQIITNYPVYANIPEKYIVKGK